MRIIPSIDIFSGRCVRLTEGDFERRTTYEKIPGDMCRTFCSWGAKLVHVVDLEGAKLGKVTNLDAIREIVAASEGRLLIQAGGGVRSEDDVEALLGAGAIRVVVGSVAARVPAEVARWAKKFGPERICVALDLRDGRVAVQGWQETRDTPLSNIVSPLADAGIVDFLSTDVSSDGKLEGPNLALYRDLCSKFPKVAWQASGGVSSMNDLEALENLGVSGAIIGKAFYEDRIDPKAVFSRWTT